MAPAAGKRLAMLGFEDLPKWKGYEEGIRLLITREGDEFIFYHACKGSLPTEEELNTIDGIFCSGSHYTAHDDSLPWVQPSARILRRAVEKGVRVFAVCFGAQILCRGLGGTVGRNPSERFVAQVEDIDLKGKGLLNLPSAQVAQSLFPQRTLEDGRLGGLRLIESHADQILELPPRAEWLATSRTAKYEAFRYTGIAEAVALQGHPELSAGDLNSIIMPSVVSAGRLSQEEARQNAELAETSPNSGLFFVAMLRSFLHGDDECDDASSVIAASQAKEELFHDLH